MKKILKGLLGVLLVLLLFVLYVFKTTGFFRTVENQFSGEILKKVKIPGVEDMQISQEDHFMIFCSDDRAGRRDGKPQQGGLYYLDVDSPLSEPRQLITPDVFSETFYPHGISMIKIDSARYKVYVINHPDGEISGRHAIEVFHLVGDSLSHQKTLTDESMISPNDIVAIDKNRFYFSNDHNSTSGLGLLAEDYLGWAASNVVYFDGENYREVANGVAYANGINKDPVRELLYLSSPRGFLVKVFEIEKNGNLTLVEDIDCGTGVDNIEFDTDGKLWIGCHPNLLKFAAYAEGKEDISPSEIITIDYRGKGDYTKEMVYLDDGGQMSAATVAPTYGDLIFVGNVMDEHFLILKK